jgi:hypothetical protein
MARARCRAGGVDDTAAVADETEVSSSPAIKEEEHDNLNKKPSPSNPNEDKPMDYSPS